MYVINIRLELFITNFYFIQSKYNECNGKFLTYAIYSNDIFHSFQRQTLNQFAFLYDTIIFQHLNLSQNMYANEVWKDQNANTINAGGWNNKH